MELKNPLYNNIGIHVNICLFTVIKGVTRVLLVKRKNEPFYGLWALPGGAMYNNETIMNAAKRELAEKTGIVNDNLFFYDYFDNINRSPLKRMIAFGFIGIIDAKTVTILKDTLKTCDAGWFDIKDMPTMAYDHNEIFDRATLELKKRIVKTNILKGFFPYEFTLPELQGVCETILERKLDRRNFRKKMITSNIIRDINEQAIFRGTRPAKVYKFNDNIEEKSII